MRLLLVANTRNLGLAVFSGFILLLTNCSFAQSNISVDSTVSVQSKETAVQKKNSFKITTLVFGGTGLLFTRINNHSTIMNGGRGSATFNNRYTFGGAGWGMPKGAELKSFSADTFKFVKMGYGGLEFGYIFFPRKRMNFGTNLLVAYGAAFKETLPKTKDSGFKMFPVLEPSLYSQIALGKLFRIDVGVTYRFISNANLPYIPDRNLRGFSWYVALLVGTCNCN
jgi:hypothetical protein